MRSMAGDTIIEVLFAVTVFSAVAVGALTVMNRGITIAQRSLEVTLVRQQVDAQAEMLRYVHDRARQESGGAYDALWRQLPKSAASPQQTLNADACPSTQPAESFALYPSAGAIARTATYGQPVTYARVSGAQAEGLYVQLLPVSGGGAYDAYIQACWHGPGSDRPMTIGTIVRVYDPSI